MGNIGWATTAVVVSIFIVGCWLGHELWRIAAALEEISGTLKDMLKGAKKRDEDWTDGN